MKVSKEELLHIAKLSNLILKEDEVESYLLNLQDILNFADIVNEASTEGLQETIGAKDEIKEFGNRDILLQNAPEQEDGMFKIPKVI